MRAHREKQLIVRHALWGISCPGFSVQLLLYSLQFEVEEGEDGEDRREIKQTLNRGVPKRSQA